MVNSNIKELIKVLKLLGQEDLCIHNIKEKEIIVFSYGVTVEESKNSLFLKGQATIFNPEISLKIEDYFEFDGINLNDFVFRINKNNLADWYIDSCLNLYGFNEKEISIDYSEELEGLLIKLGY